MRGGCAFLLRPVAPAFDEENPRDQPCKIIKHAQLRLQFDVDGGARAEVAARRVRALRRRFLRGSGR